MYTDRPAINITALVTVLNTVSVDNKTVFEFYCTQ